MGVQLIFVVETNKKCNSDWIYIKDTVDYFYSYEQTELKFTPIYMDGKGNYFKKEKEVKSKIKQYKVSSKENNSKVLYCFDCDESNTKQEDASFLKKVKKFCKEEGYEFVDFYLLPDYRHQGYGKQILQEILPAYPDLYLYVFTRNQIAIKLYQQFGFEEVEKISSSRIKMKKSA